MSGFENALFHLLSAAVFTFLVSLIRSAFDMGSLLPAITVSDVLPILWIGLINTGIGEYCYLSSIGLLPAQSVAIIGYVEPLFSVLLCPDSERTDDSRANPRGRLHYRRCAVRRTLRA